ncbi:MAG: hypothetical protein QF400_03165 [Candidatus Peribacteraceae bacterium]|nr:hypothetical protein [Candidatus Peribacteraceae bacterium]
MDALYLLTWCIFRKGITMLKHLLNRAFQSQAIANPLATEIVDPKKPNRISSGTVMNATNCLAGVNHAWNAKFGT